MERYKYQKFDILKRKGNQYEFEPFPYKVPEMYNNIHLPNLLANFIKENILHALDNYNLGNNAHILDGVETDNFNHKERSVVLILYVKK